jgi:hypothetical protein
VGIPSADAPRFIARSSENMMTFPSSVAAPIASAVAVEPTDGLDQGLVGEVVLEPAAQQDPPAFDLHQFTGQNHRVLQDVADRDVAKEDVTEYYRRIEVRYHLSARSSPRAARGSRFTSGGRSRYRLRDDARRVKGRPAGRGARSATGWLWSTTTIRSPAAAFLTSALRCALSFAMAMVLT